MTKFVQRYGVFPLAFFFFLVSAVFLGAYIGFPWYLVLAIDVLGTTIFLIGLVDTYYDSKGNLRSRETSSPGEKSPESES